MNKRDADILDALLLKLTAHFNDPKAPAVIVTRGEGRAIVAALRERKAIVAGKPAQEEQPQGGLQL